MNILKVERTRYGGGEPPKIQKFLRKTQGCKFLPLKLVYQFLFRHYCKKNCCDISWRTQIAPGVYFGHPYCIVINSRTVIGSNVNIHKGVTIGQENRGRRKGVPTIGNEVWIGINATVVGKIKIGNDVLIAPNAFVNFDVPDHSIVLGNPARIIHRDNATEHYINDKVNVE